MAVTEYCLDSWAAIAYLRSEGSAAERVERVLDAEPAMSWVNLGEVYYITARELGHGRAREIVDDLRTTLRVVDVSRDQTLAAAAIKADYRMSYADAFAVATAIEHDAVLLTGDPEIIGAGGDWAIEDLRQ